MPVPGIEEVVVKKNWGECLGKPGSPCLNVQIQYPRLKNSSTEAAVTVSDQISSEIKNALLFPNEETGNDLSVEEIADLILADYQSFAGEDPEFSPPWKITVRGEVIFLNAQVLTIKIQHLHDLGGDRPGKFIKLKSFFLNSGKPVQLKDLFLSSQVLKEAVLKNISAEKKLHPVFDRKNFNGIFTENNNFGLTDKGLLFIINAPNSWSLNDDNFLELIIPWEDLPVSAEIKKLFDDG